MRARLVPATLLAPTLVLAFAVACGGSGGAVVQPSDPGSAIDVGFGDGNGDPAAPDPVGETAPCVPSPDPAAGRFDAECAGVTGCRAMTPSTTCACLACDGPKCVEGQYLHCPGDEDAVVGDAEDVPADPIGDPAGDPVKEVAFPDPGQPDTPYCQDISPTPIPIGHPCSEDCECETGMCYREAYTLGIGICTKQCQGEAGGTGCPDPNKKFKCLVFGTAHKDTYALTIMNICMPICMSLQDCKDISDVYGNCPGDGKKMTEWEGITIGGQATCQIAPM
jgi:hypothetical protein